MYTHTQAQRVSTSKMPGQQYYCVAPNSRHTSFHKFYQKSGCFFFDDSFQWKPARENQATGKRSFSDKKHNPIPSLAIEARQETNHTHITDNASLLPILESRRSLKPRQMGNLMPSTRQTPGAQHWFHRSSECSVGATRKCLANSTASHTPTPSTEQLMERNTNPGPLHSKTSALSIYLTATCTKTQDRQTD